MVLLARCALMGIPANASPVDDTTLPASGDAPSAASVALGDTTAQAAATATAVIAVPTQRLALRLAFIVVTLLRCGGDAGRKLRLLPLGKDDDDTPSTGGFKTGVVPFPT